MTSTKRDNLKPFDPQMIPKNDQVELEEPKIKQENKIVKPKTKGCIGSLYIESIIIQNKPKFLCKNSQNEIYIQDNIELEEEIIRPLVAEECGYLPYTFASEQEISSNNSREITREEILDEIKQQIDHFIVATPEVKTIILGDILITFCQEWISTTNFPFFVGETESGKSTGLHLAKWLGYRCLYGEDIPSADIYNFLGLDEEGSGMIAEDEAQDIYLNREKMNMYKNSYSKGSKKSRIIGVDSLKRRQVHFKTFCPKWFAGERVPYNKGFIERLAIIHMVEGEPKGNIKRPTSDEVNQLQQLRNKLLIWKMQNIGKEFQITKSGLKGRDQELWEDFLTLGIGTKYEESFRETVKQYTEQRQNKIKDSIEARLFNLICDKIDENLGLRFESYWEYLIGDQFEISGRLNDFGPNTFLADEYNQKITRQYLAKLFEEKFQGTKQTIKEKKDGRLHQVTIYQFKGNVILSLVKKYGIDLPLNHLLYVGEVGQLGDQDDQCNQHDKHKLDDQENNLDHNQTGV